MARVCIVIAALLLSVICGGQAVEVPNPGFEDGAQGSPGGWRLTEGAGAWETNGHETAQCVSVTGTGEDSNSWQTEELAFAPGETYQVSVWMRTAPGTSGGCIVTGPSFANRDYQAGEQWERKAFVFRTPDTVGGGYLRFGQWMVRGKVFFDDVQLVPVQPLNTRVDGIELGDGERIARGRYQARLRFGYEGSNYSPCLQHSQAATFGRR